LEFGLKEEEEEGWFKGTNIEAEEISTGASIDQEKSARES
jgi:hypothetical protein